MRARSYADPLAVLAAGALVAGIVFHDAFIGEALPGVLEGRLFTRPDNHILEECIISRAGSAARRPS